MKKVLAFGTFDIFHSGHEFYLQEAKKLGDYLVVAVALDETVLELKGELPKNSQEQRLKVIKSLPYVNKALLGYKEDKYKVIEEVNPDIIALGYDQNSFTRNLEKELKKRNLKPKVVRITSYSPEIYKSSIIKKQKR
jgi:FAD synthetase